MEITDPTAPRRIVSGVPPAAASMEAGSVPVTRRRILERIVLVVLIALGTVALSSWCGPAPSVDWSSPWPALFLALSVAGFNQTYPVWYLYLRFQERQPRLASPGKSVDVMITTCNESPGLIASTLAAAAALRYPHRTYLLDDGNDPRLDAIAAAHGATILRRDDRRDLKAGNLNAALPRTSGDFVAIFDVDHAPSPEFLDRTLGYFEDEKVGFVQAMLTFSNASENLIAQASAATSYEYYNITAVAKDRCGAAGLMGSNAVIRRTALESIGGYRPGLAEDLETSIALHAAGWDSAYVCEPLAPGLTPADLVSFFKQQLKWSRGVFEAAWCSLTSGRFLRLRPLQQMCYAIRFSYYLAGAGGAVLGLTLAAGLIAGQPCVEVFFARLLAITVIAAVIRGLALMSWATDPNARKPWLVLAVSVVFVTWPIYLLALLTTLARIRVPFLATPKAASISVPWWMAGPQLVMAAALAAAVTFRLVHHAGSPMPCSVTYALLVLGFHWILLPAMVPRGARLRVLAERPA